MVNIVHILAFSKTLPSWIQQAERHCTLLNVTMSTGERNRACVCVCAHAHVHIYIYKHIHTHKLSFSVVWNNKCRCWITVILYKYVCKVKHQAQNIRDTSSYNTSGSKDTGSRTCQTNLSDGSSHRLGSLWSCWTGTWTGLGFERSHTLWHTLCQDELFTQLDVRASLGCHSA